MFLLFQFLRYHHGFCFQDLHSNMFLLFLSSARRKRSLRQFTFQYVSIISDVSDLERKLLMRFTFQYVSIISVLPFFSFHFQSYLHSNMFLLFRITNSIYATYNHNLHSNMFLLFQLLVEQGYTDFENLHSNMFLLFLTSNLIKSLLDFIYIPICFYYFQDEHIFIENGISFTFQYVSIISQQCQKEAQFTAIYIPICFYYFPSIPSALIPSGSSFTFQYVSIISRFPFLATLITYIFTFQYVSIISFLFSPSVSVAPSFTFQYVSIISVHSRTIDIVRSKFTFQYVSIISRYTF